MIDKHINIYDEIISKQKDSEMRLFIDSQKEIRSELKKYSLKNILTALFISSIWIPNISSQVKHPYIYLILLSIDEQDFIEAEEPWGYDKFSSFLEKIYSLVPSFPSVEDYIPEYDWGDVKYCFDNINYKIFYGNELSNIYEYINIFEIVICAKDEVFVKTISRSPFHEMKISLILQDHILSNIDSCFDSAELSIQPGHTEIPCEKFFNESLKYINNLNLRSIVPHSILKTYSYDYQNNKINKPSWESFYKNISNGDFFLYYFIKYKDKYYPVLPRRYTVVIFESWSKLFQKNYSILNIDEDGINSAISVNFYKFFKNRIMTSTLFPAISAVEEDGNIHSLIYDFTFISKNKLFLIKLLPPSYSNEQIEQCLERNLPVYKQSLQLIKKIPITLALNLDRQNVQFQNNKDINTLTPILLIIIPQISTSISGVTFDKEFPGEIMFLDSFLGIADEVDNVEEFSDFFDYLQMNVKTMGPIYSTMDLFGSYKDSFGILIEGALSPTMVSIDPHWGTKKRYDTLKNFWTLFPSIGYFDDPRSWKVEQESLNRVRLIARSYLGSAIYTQKSGKHIFFTSPFKDLNYETGRLANLLMECLEDSLEQRIEIIKQHVFFNQDICERIDVLFFPSSLVNNIKYKHLKHLHLNENNWTSDGQLIKHDNFGIRFLFDDSKILNVFQSVNDQTIEAEICIEFMRRINSLYPDKNCQNIIQKIKLTRSGVPRFKMFVHRKEAAFPDFVGVYRPELTDFKKARKRIAEICKSVGFVEGSYSLEDAKVKINKLKSKLINEINSEVNKYTFNSSIEFLLTRIGALQHEYFRGKKIIEHGVTHEIDYDPNIRFAAQHESFIREHRNFRYLTEKFVQIKPSGIIKLDKSSFQYLTALTDWIITFYSASDLLHYGIHPIGMNVTYDYLVNVELDKEFQEMEDSYGETLAKIRLGVIGRNDDKIDTECDYQKFYEELDKVFLLEQGFMFSDMIRLLELLCQWPLYIDDSAEKTNYSAKQEEIFEVYRKINHEITKVQLASICNFLTLKSSDVLKITGSDELCDDLPVWEHRKRFSRYTIKPLIEIDDRFIWEPYSVGKSRDIWSSAPIEGYLPADIESSKIERVIQNRKREIENILVTKTEQIIKRYTENAVINLKLHKLDKEGNHPIDLGDYDVFAYIKSHNSILCVECKDILPAFCMKDSKRIRDKIFGRNGKSSGYVGPVKKRHEYIAQKYNRILNSLGWSFNEQPTVLSIFVSRNYYLWTMFPPDKTDIFFTQIDLLSDFINELHGK